MWTKLSHADIEAAREELKNRRERMLIRHAHELKEVDDNKAEIASLERALGAFFEKFAKPAAAAEYGGAAISPAEPPSKPSYPDTAMSSVAFGLRAIAGAG